MASLLQKNNGAIQNFTARITDMGGCSVPQPDINSILAKFAQIIAIITCEVDKEVQFIKYICETCRSVGNQITRTNWLDCFLVFAVEFESVFLPLGENV